MDETATLTELSAFLSGQLLPNAVVPSPPKGRAGLILSYKMSPEAEGYRFIYGKSHLYDNGLAAIALLLLEKPQESERILDAIVGGAFGRRDLWFSVNTQNEWPTEQDSDWATTRTGATAWAGYALVFYLVDKELTSPGILKRDARLQRYLEFAEALGESLLQRQIQAVDDPRHGLITGGSGVISLVTRGTEVEEKFERREVEWISYENNIDAYFFLRDLAALSARFRKEHGASVERLGRAIRSGFDVGIGQIRRGAGPKGGDPLEALDCASWGSMALRALGANTEAETALKAAARYRGVDGDARGFKPYINMPVYEFPEAQKLFFPKHPSTTWNELPFVWSEGTFGVALAELRAGSNTVARDIAAGVLESSMNQRGGVKYASRTLKFQFGESPSVSGSAWAVLVLKNLQEDGRARRFWAESAPLLR